MSDLTVPCPYCHTLTCWSSRGTSDAPREAVGCYECGYQQVAEFDSTASLLEASTGVHPLGTPAPHCTEFVIYRPPHLRLEYVRGNLPITPGLPPEVPAALRRSLIDGLSELGECPFGHLDARLYTTSIEGHPGFRRYALEVFDGYLEVVGGPNALFLTVFPTFAIPAPDHLIKLYGPLA